MNLLAAFFILFLIGAVPYAILDIIRLKRKKVKERMREGYRKKTMEDHLERINDFSVTQKVIGLDCNCGLAIDENRKKVCLIDYRQESILLRVVSYNDLLSSELYEDGEIITRTVRSSQIGGVLIGGLLLGRAGAIIGGLSGDTRSSGSVNKIDLRLMINDTKKPLHDVNFLNLETKRGGSRYQQATQQARHWHGLIEVLIKRADAEDKADVTNSTTVIQSSSVSDEIKKLADLLNSGVLSANEFQQQKAKLLS